MGSVLKREKGNRFGRHKTHIRWNTKDLESFFNLALIQAQKEMQRLKILHSTYYFLLEGLKSEEECVIS